MWRTRKGMHAHCSGWCLMQIAIHDANVHTWFVAHWLQMSHDTPDTLLFFLVFFINLWKIKEIKRLTCVSFRLKYIILNDIAQAVNKLLLVKESRRHSRLAPAAVGNFFTPYIHFQQEKVRDFSTVTPIFFFKFQFLILSSSYIENLKKF